MGIQVVELSKRILAVISTCAIGGDDVRIVVQPNRSLSWRGNVMLAASLALLCMGIATVYAIFGFWMVIPFAGAEVIFVSACLYWTVRRLSRQEVITVGEDTIRLEWGYRQPEQAVDLPRHWSRLQFRRDESPFDVGHLSLGAHGKHYTLGGDLGRDEKWALYTELKQALAGSPDFARLQPDGAD